MLLFFTSAVEFFIFGRPHEFVARSCFQTAASNSRTARNVLPDSGDTGQGKL